MSPDSILRNVDCFHAVDGGGNCLVGPHVPLGLVRPGPDCVNYNTSGYASGELIVGFSHLHVSGTGGSGRYGNLLITPQLQAPDPRLRSYAKDNEEAVPGYYRVDLLAREVFGEMKPPSMRMGCELTCTARCAVHRYTFAPDSEPGIRIDFDHCLAGTGLNAAVELNTQGEITGRADYKGGWGHDHPYSIYFVVRLLTKPLKVHLACAQGTATGLSVYGQKVSASIEFAKGSLVELQVGISFTSVAQALRNLSNECADHSFEQIRAKAEQSWAQVLNRIVVEGGEEHQRRLLSTFLYRLYAMPDDLGLEENPWFPNQHRQFNNFYCLWDSVRNANSLFALIDAPLARDIVNALLEIGDQTGWVPDAWIMGHSASIQGGCSADVLFCEAALKGLQGIDFHAALRRMQDNHEKPSPNPEYYGRYPGYRSNGFLAAGVINCVSRTLEYTEQDACQARLARWLGLDDAATAAARRVAKLWENWRDDKQCFGPRDREGLWLDFDPWRPSRTDFWFDPNFYEGTAHDWALTCWHALPQLIQRHGGAAAFIAHLDRYLDSQYVWKEINLHTPWLYHFAGRPDLSARKVRQMLRKHYKEGPMGLSDNEDMGSHSAFFIASAIGLYPVPGFDFYLVNAPLFQRTVIQPAGCEAAIIVEVEGVLTGDVCVVAADWNGEPLQDAFIKHERLVKGGTLRIQVAAQAGTWGNDTTALWSEMS